MAQDPLVQPELDEKGGWRRRKRREWGAFDGSSRYEERIGEYALGVDRSVVRRLVTGEGIRILDLPCGAGRMSHDLRDGRESTLVSADYSPDMLATARTRLGNPLVRCDAFSLPFAAGSFDRVLTLRLVFHYDDPLPILAEAARVLRPRGEMVFDTLNRFSCRHLAELVLRLLGRRRGQVGLTFAGRAAIEATLRKAGFEVAEVEARYLLPTRLYRSLPRLVCRALAAVETLIPSSLRVLTYWRVVRRV